ncbi:Leucine-rich repeat transmembrane protein kinase family protein [Striga hermonthica]|uniref:Leucine-rich repeat transmembrane protein kinase family protein n=1 Tax=Striga hermonthica TaxID=68872 RepID=A0A9N7NZT6_STRHE|nr:Leucine-rich repeat transmembrane protein kinase family protein [Striga hermonthica]
MALYLILFLILLLHLDSSRSTQSRFFELMKSSTRGDSLSSWQLNDTNNNTHYCNLPGISCDHQENIIQVDISGWLLTGRFPDDICTYLPTLQILRLGRNTFTRFPRGLTNCSHLREFNATRAYFTGPFPDLSPLQKTLQILDLSENRFSGDFPVSALTNLTNLESVNLNNNQRLNLWQLPNSMTSLTRLKSMILTTCMLGGTIPPSLGNMTSLVDLELSGNYLVGPVPKELGRLPNLKLLELYYNQLEGEIPPELGNLTGLTDLDISVNRLVGRIPDSICRLPMIRMLQFYNNSLVGSIPESIGNSTTLFTLSLYRNYLTGRVPPGLGRLSGLVGLDLSENQLSGPLPDGLCSMGKLKFLLVLQNSLSREIPASYAECESLIRFRVSSNNLEGKIPPGIFALPHVSIIDVEKNNLTGPIPEDIRAAKNLSELFMHGNRISGRIPREIARATNLVKIDLSANLLSGPIPWEIGSLKSLNLLMLQNNELSSNIPESLSNLKSLNVLDLSSNCLTGNVPGSLSRLLPNSLNFSNNRLSGEVPFPLVNGGVLESFTGNPGLCLGPTYGNTTTSSGANFPICPSAFPDRRRTSNSLWAVGVSVCILVIGAVLLFRTWYRKNKLQQVYYENGFASYDVKSFHRLSFDQREILDAMVDKNIVGYGGSGAVYRIELNSGETVAVKKLWAPNTNNNNNSNNKKCIDDDDVTEVLDRELKTEVETLGSVRHKNIVKLYCYFAGPACSLLVYEYMTNGNLWDALHEGKGFLDWPIRHQIALGVAQGLSYLHHDLMPPIVHRDIKSTNILLDVDYLPKVADFGIAKVLQARGSKDSATTTLVAGTYGYLAPEYAYTSKATTKCDVYSFGVVLMELLTGKRPVEPEFGDNKNIIYWVATKVETKEEAAVVLDKRVLGMYREDMIKVLKIAIRCTCRNPASRPAMNEVVQLLIEADPCKFDCCKFFSGKDNNDQGENNDPIKIKEQLDI